MYALRSCKSTENGSSRGVLALPCDGLLIPAFIVEGGVERSKALIGLRVDRVEKGYARYGDIYTEAK